MDDYNPFSLSFYKKNKIDNKNTHNSTIIKQFEANNKYLVKILI
jgi:hypothetical protein